MKSAISFLHSGQRGGNVNIALDEFSHSLDWVTNAAPDLDVGGAKPNKPTPAQCALGNRQYLGEFGLGDKFLYVFVPLFEKCPGRGQWRPELLLRSQQRAFAVRELSVSPLQVA
jgi:hypothetical protein